MKFAQQQVSVRKLRTTTWEPRNFIPLRSLLLRAVPTLPERTDGRTAVGYRVRLHFGRYENRVLGVMRGIRTAYANVQLGV